MLRAATWPGRAAGRRRRRPARLATAWRTGRGEPATTLVFHLTNAGAEQLSVRLGIAMPVLGAQRAMGAHVGPGVVGVAWLQPPGSEVQRRSNAAS